jgi:sialate O-acetylesterase
VYGDQSIEVGPRPAKVERHNSDVVRIHFDSVNGKLLPKDHIAGFSLFAPGSQRDMVCAAYVAPDCGSTVMLRTIRSIKPDSAVWYGKGLFPYCNLTDAADLAAPAFGPWKI